MLLDFLHHENDEREKQKILGMLDNASVNLLDTIDNLNEVLAINANINVEKKVINLFEKLKSVEKNLADVINENQAQIESDFLLNDTITTVPAYLESILMNFITNGIKYRHPNRKPIILLSLEKGKPFTILTIKDNGLGIDLKKYGNKLFGMYKTFHTHENARGMGLYITKNQIEAMGGRIEVESNVGVGTTFKIYFNEED
jgi:signal transduction histidine kinase